jgi:hypothetical protein
MSSKKACIDAFFQHLPIDKVKILLFFITWTELGGILTADELERRLRLTETCLRSEKVVWFDVSVAFADRVSGLSTGDQASSSRGGLVNVQDPG